MTENWSRLSKQRYHQDSDSSRSYNDASITRRPKAVNSTELSGTVPVAIANVPVQSNNLYFIWKWNTFSPPGLTSRLSRLTLLPSFYSVLPFKDIMEHGLRDCYRETHMDCHSSERKWHRRTACDSSRLAPFTY